MTRDQWIAQLRQFLQHHRTAGIATVDDHGQPHAANVWYASDARLRLYFISSPDSAHSRHLLRQPAVALAIYAHVDEPASIHGLQLHGRCEVLDPDSADHEHALDVFSAKYPAIAAGVLLRQRMATERFHRVTLTWARWIDNRVKFGFKHEGDLNL